MTQDEIIEMARQAGMELDDSFVLEKEQIWYFCKENFIAFAKLVAAKEREACAKMVDHICKEGGGTYGDAIRARGEA